MNYRQTSLLAADDIGTAGTKVIDVTLKDVISRINVQIKATNTNGTPIAHPAAILKGLELIDGSDVLWSCNGYEALAVNFYDDKRTPFCVNNYLTSVMNITHYQMSFGRFLYDELLALDPAKFRNLQLKVIHDLALGGSTGSACTLDITADIFDDKAPTPQGFLSTKELLSYTLSGGANEYIDLPVDLTLRKILIQSLYGGKSPHEQYNTIMLDEDNRKRIPFEDSTSDLMKYVAALYPRIQEGLIGGTSSTEVDFFVMSAYDLVSAFNAWGTWDIYLMGAEAAGGKVGVTSSGGGGNFQGLITGMAPFGALPLPFGNQDVIEDWFDLADVGNLRLTLKAGSSPGANSTCQIITQQLRPYAA